MFLGLPKSEGRIQETAARSRSFGVFHEPRFSKNKTKGCLLGDWEGVNAHVGTYETGRWCVFCFPMKTDLASPHFSGLHALSAVIWHVHKGHLADAPGLCDPQVLVAVTLAWDNLIHLKHTEFSASDLRYLIRVKGKTLHHNHHHILTLANFIFLHCYLKFLESSSAKRAELAVWSPVAPLLHCSCRSDLLGHIWYITASLYGPD